MFTNSHEVLPSSDGPMLRYWSKVRKLCNAEGEIRFPILNKLVRGVMCIPHGDADVERLFSNVNNIKTSLRNSLGNDTVVSLLIIKLNCDKTCFGFEPTKEMLEGAQSATYKYLQQAKTSRTASASISHAAVVESEPTASRQRKQPRTLSEYMCL